MAALTDVAIAQAMVANGRWSARLGWDRYVDAIDVLLGAAPGTPAAAVFSSALADWQAVSTVAHREPLGVAHREPV